MRRGITKGAGADYVRRRKMMKGRGERGDFAAVRRFLKSARQGEF